MAYGQANDYQRVSYYDAHEWNLDKTVTPHTMVRGMLGKDAAGAWQQVLVSASNRRLMISGTLTATATTSPLSADSSNVSAIQGDAGLMRISAIGGSDGLLRMNVVSGSAAGVSANQQLSARILEGTAYIGSVSALQSGGTAWLISAHEIKQSDAAALRISAYADDASKFRVSAIGGTAGDNIIVDGTNQTLSATILSAITVRPTGRPILTAPVSEDAGLFRLSALGVTLASAQALSATLKEGTAFIGQVSALQSGGTAWLVSAHEVKQSDAASMHVSVVGTLTVSSHEVKQSDGAALRISALNQDANFMHVSAVGTMAVSAHEVKQSDAAAMLVSAKQGDAVNLNVSAKSDSAALFRISAFQGDGANLNISAKSSDAGTMHVSAYPAAMATYFTSGFDVATTATAVVSGVASKTIKIYAINLTLVPSGGIKWTGGATDLQGITRLSASAGYVMCVNPPAYLIATTSAGTDLALALSGTVSASGWVAGWSS